MYGTFLVGDNFQGVYDPVGAGAKGPNGPAGLFVATAAGIVGGVVAVTSAPALYNPPQSGKLYRIQTVRLGDVSGTIIRGNIRYYWAQNPILSGLTLGTILPRTRGVATSALFYTALTVAAAATQFMQSGLGSGGAVAAQFYNLRSDEYGFPVWPGEIFYPYVSNAALAMAADVTVEWIETPITSGN